MSLTKAIISESTSRIVDAALIPVNALARQYRKDVRNLTITDNYSFISEGDLKYHLWNSVTQSSIFVTSSSDFISLRDSHIYAYFVDTVQKTTKFTDSKKLIGTQKEEFEYFKLLSMNLAVVYSYCSVLKQAINDQTTLDNMSSACSIQALSNFNLFNSGKYWAPDPAFVTACKQKLKYLISPSVEARIAEIVLAYEMKKD